MRQHFTDHLRHDSPFREIQDTANTLFCVTDEDIALPMKYDAAHHTVVCHNGPERDGEDKLLVRKRLPDYYYSTINFAYSALKLLRS